MIYKLIEQNEFDYYRLSSLDKEALCKDVKTGKMILFNIIDKNFYDDNGTKLETNQHDASLASYAGIKEGEYYDVIIQKKYKEGIVLEQIKVIVEQINIILNFKDRGSDPDYKIIRLRYIKAKGLFTNDDTQNNVTIEKVSEEELKVLKTVEYPKSRVFASRPTLNVSQEQLEEYVVEFAKKKNREGWVFYTITQVRLESRHYSSKVLFGFLNKESHKGIIHVLKKNSTLKSIVDYLYDWFVIRLSEKTFKKTSFIKELSEYITNEKKKTVDTQTVPSVDTQTVKECIVGIQPNMLAQESKRTIPIQIDTSGISIVDYSDKSIAILGNTKKIKDELKRLGGFYNPNLKWKNKKMSGWIYQKSARKRVEEALGLKQKDKDKDDSDAIEEYSKKFEKYIEEMDDVDLKKIIKDNINNITFIKTRPETITDSSTRRAREILGQFYRRLKEIHSTSS
jgi:hypothetical protein